jgi:hypothetical protein
MRTECIYKSANVLRSILTIAIHDHHRLNVTPVGDVNETHCDGALVSHICNEMDYFEASDARIPTHCWVE